MKSAMRDCGYPEWTLNRKPKEREKDQDEPRGKVVIPYVKTVSEKVAGVLKKFNVQTTYETKKLCVRLLDKIGAVYKAKCNKHKNIYVGETDKALKERGYDHKTVTHKELIESHTVKKTKQNDQTSVTNTRKVRETLLEKTTRKCILERAYILQRASRRYPIM